MHKARILLASLFMAFASGCGGGGVEPVNHFPSQRGVVNVPAGFQIIGNHGFVQVDENFINFGLVSKGQVSVPAGSGAMGRATITVSGITPMLCLRPLNSYAAIIQADRSGNQFTFTIAGTAAETFEYFVFDQMIDATASGFGVHVRDQNGITTFNSLQPPMIISSITTIPTITPTYNVAEVPIVTLDTGIAKKYAACLSEGRLVSAPSAGSSTLVFTDAIKVTETGAVTTMGVRQPAPRQTANPAIGGGQILLVDVTGL